MIEDNQEISTALNDGHTRVPNALLEAIIISKLTGIEKSVLLLAIRRTYGWTKDRKVKSLITMLSLQDIQDMLEISKKAAYGALKRLTTSNVLKRMEIGKGKGYQYQVNTTLSEWNDAIINKLLLSQITTVGYTRNATVGYSRRYTVARSSLRHLFKENKRNIKREPILNKGTYIINKENSNINPSVSSFNGNSQRSPSTDVSIKAKESVTYGGDDTHKSTIRELVNRYLKEHGPSRLSDIRQAIGITARATAVFFSQHKKEYLHIGRGIWSLPRNEIEQPPKQVPTNLDVSHEVSESDPYDSILGKDFKLGDVA